MNPLRTLTLKELKDISKKSGIKYSYLLNIRYEQRRPSSKKAKRIELASNGRISRLELLYPEEYKPKTVNPIIDHINKPKESQVD